MNTKLQMAANLSFPLEIVTQAIGIIAKRRAGKSYTVRRLAEQLLKAGQQVVIVDPKGDTWGIRSSADGKSPGLPVVILGGEHGDAPLGAGTESGEIVAKLVTEERVSVLLDLSEFRKHEVATFMTAFMENLYRLKAKEVYRTPMMLIVDEADAIMPQKPQKGAERMLGAGDDIVRRGGQRGIGVALVTQRTAVLNKNVLTQCQVLIALRTIAPQDLKAMDAWVEVHGTIEERDTLMASLPSLPVGDAWVWSPGWPTAEGIFKRVHILPIETFDSGATPKSGEKRIEPKKLADVDIDALTRQMGALIEKKKADDPKELRKEIAALRKELATTKPLGVGKEAIKEAHSQGRNEAHALAQHDAAREIAKVEKHWRAELQRVVTAIKSAAITATGDVVKAINSATETAVSSALSQSPTIRNNDLTTSTPVRRPVGPAVPSRVPPRGQPLLSTPHEGITGVEQKILNTLKALQEMGISPVDKATAAALVGYHPNAKSYANALGSLRTSGRITYPTGGMVELTAEGESIATSQLSITSVDELHETWYDRLGNVAKLILAPLIEAYPEAMDGAALAEAAGYHPNAKSFANMRGRLRTLGLIDYPSTGKVVATRVLFPEGLA